MATEKFLVYVLFKIATGRVKEHKGKQSISQLLEKQYCSQFYYLWEIFIPDWAVIQAGKELCGLAFLNGIYIFSIFGYGVETNALKLNSLSRSELSIGCPQ